MIKAIIYDLGGVLIDDPWPGMATYYSEALHVDKDKFIEAYNKIVSIWQTGKITEKECWTNITTSLNTHMPTSETLWLDGFKQTINEKKEIFLQIESFKKRGYKIGLLSNTEAPIMQFVLEQKYQDFDVYVFSCDIGVAKPNPKIYIEILRRLQIKPLEAVFIDDKEENIESAKALGIHGILFTTSPQVITSIENLLA
ncbi:HAD family phosphatase [soil metagenome]